MDYTMIAEMREQEDPNEKIKRLQERLANMHIELTNEKLMNSFLIKRIEALEASMKPSLN